MLERDHFQLLLIVELALLIVMLVLLLRLGRIVVLEERNCAIVNEVAIVVIGTEWELGPRSVDDRVALLQPVLECLLRKLEIDDGHGAWESWEDRGNRGRILSLNGNGPVINNCCRCTDISHIDGIARFCLAHRSRIHRRQKKRIVNQKNVVSHK